MHDGREFDAGRRIPSLDGLRGIAIILVMLYHFTIYGGSRPGGVFNNTLYSLAETGWIGVDLFFILSGFLITGILLDTRLDSDYLRNFFVRRMLRIFPLYYAALLLFLVLTPLVAASPDGIAAEVDAWPAYLMYLVNVRMAIDGWPAFGYLGHFWTLAVEEQFYLLWPLVVLFVRPVQLLWTCMALFVAALAVRIGWHAIDNEVAAFVLMPSRVDTLAAGAIVAVLVRDPDRFARVRQWARPIIIATGVTVTALVFVTRGLDPENHFVGTVGFTAIAILFAAILLELMDSERRGVAPRFMRAAPLVAFGKYSYAIYVLHHPPLFFLPQQWSVDTLAERMGSWLPAQMTFVLVMSAMSLAAAVVSWHVFERHFIRLKDTLAPQKNRHARGTLVPVPQLPTHVDALPAVSSSSR